MSAAHAVQTSVRAAFWMTAAAALLIGPSLAGDAIANWLGI